VIAKKMDPPTATCKGHTPKEAIKDLLHGINKDAQKRIFKELLEELEEEKEEKYYPSLNDMIKSDQDYIDSLGIEKEK
jgi:thioredoxin-like negative regulator of GroEL